MIDKAVLNWRRRPTTGDVGQIKPGDRALSPAWAGARARPNRGAREIKRHYLRTYGRAKLAGQEIERPTSHYPFSSSNP